MLFLLVMLCLPMSSVHAVQQSLSFTSNSTPEFLRKEEAFQATTATYADHILINWQIAPEYYLYLHGFKYAFNPEATAKDQPSEVSSQPHTVTLGEPQYDRPGVMKVDEYFGEVSVYHNQVTLKLPFNALSNQSGELVLGYQGCAEAGLCYPPAKVRVPVELTANSESMDISKTTDPGASASIPSVSETNASAQTEPGTANTSTNLIVNQLQEQHLLLIIALFFIMGLGLTFTPCVLPMVPILSSVILGRKEKLSPVQGFVLSSSYVIGMALAFAIAGVLVGMSGQRIQFFMQSPYVLVTFAIVFVLLALSMFGFYELQLPEKLRSRLSDVNARQSGGSLIGVFIMGALSALVVSPCVSAPLAGILIYIAQEGDAVLGGIALLALGFGMGAPLIVIGTTGANLLPKAGSWMEVTKVFFGIALLAVAAYLVRTVLPGPIMLIIWASLIIVPAIYMGALNALEPASSGWQKFWKGIGIIMLIYGAAMIWGAAQGSSDPLQPIQPTQIASGTAGTTQGAKKLPFVTVTTLAELEAALTNAQQRKRPVMLDYYADWCIACLQMQKGAFADPRTHQRLTDFQLIKADVTAVNRESEALMDRFELIGPPTILFFTANGTRISAADVVGEMDADTFVQHIDAQVVPNLVDR